jgi:exodeoxyribonuclease VII small subunit
MAKKNFESALVRLEEITRELEEGDLSLENSLKIFNEGIRLAAYCSEQLAEAQKKVEILVQKDERSETIPFDG